LNGVATGKKFDDIVSRLDTINMNVSDGRTDRRTDRQTSADSKDGAYA